MPLTRHASRDNADQGCSQKALAPLATFASRYRGVATSNLRLHTAIYFPRVRKNFGLCSNAPLSAVCIVHVASNWSLPMKWRKPLWTCG